MACGQSGRERFFMSRRQAREAALQTLFQLELNPPPESDAEEAWQTQALDAAVEESPVEGRRDYSYAASLVRGTRGNLAAIDEAIAAAAHDWKLERMTGVDRNIVRIAVYEMKYGAKKVDVGVAINEAVELAKRYGTDKSPAFVNGVLAKIS